MRPNRHPSPLPPDPPGHGSGSPLPPDPPGQGSGSPLRPDPVTYATKPMHPDREPSETEPVTAAAGPGS